MVVIQEEVVEENVYLTDTEFATLEQVVAEAIKKKKAPKRPSRPNLPPAEQLDQILAICDSAYEDQDWTMLAEMTHGLVGEMHIDWLPQLPARNALAKASLHAGSAAAEAQACYMNHPEEADAYLALAVTCRASKPLQGLRWLAIAAKAGLNTSTPLYRALTNELEWVKSLNQLIKEFTEPILVTPGHLESFNLDSTEWANLTSDVFTESLNRVRAAPSTIISEMEKYPEFYQGVMEIWFEGSTFRVGRLTPEQLEPHKQNAGDFGKLDAAALVSLAGFLNPLDVAALQQTCVYLRESLDKPEIEKAVFLGVTGCVPRSEVTNKQWHSLYEGLKETLIVPPIAIAEMAKPQPDENAVRRLVPLLHMIPIHAYSQPLVGLFANFITMLHVDSTPNTAKWLLKDVANFILPVSLFDVSTSADAGTWRTVVLFLSALVLAAGDEVIAKLLEFNFKQLCLALGVSQPEAFGLLGILESHKYLESIPSSSDFVTVDSGPHQGLDVDDAYSGLYHLSIIHHHMNLTDKRDIGIVKLNYDGETLSGTGVDSLGGHFILESIPEVPFQPGATNFVFTITYVQEESGSDGKKGSMSGSKKSTEASAPEGTVILFQAHALFDRPLFTGACSMVPRQSEDDEFLGNEQKAPVFIGSFALSKDSREFTEELWKELEEKVKVVAADHANWAVPKPLEEEKTELHSISDLVRTCASKVLLFRSPNVPATTIMETLQEMDGQIPISEQDLEAVAHDLGRGENESERRFAMRCQAAALVASALSRFRAVLQISLGDTYHEDMTILRKLTHPRHQEIVHKYRTLFAIHSWEPSFQPLGLVNLMSDNEKFAKMFLEAQQQGSANGNNANASNHDDEDQEDDAFDPFSDRSNTSSKSKKKKSKKQRGGLSTGAIVAISAVGAIIVAVGAFFIGTRLSSNSNKKSKE